MPTPDIYILCPSYDQPVGGIKKLYRHCDVLNQYGFSASILHETADFRCSWFANTTKIAYTAETRLAPGDCLVLPEIYGPRMADIARGVPKVILNQNGYFTFKGYTLDKDEFTTPYLDPEVIATIVVSEDSRGYLEYAFPQHRLFRVHNSIDPDLFCYEAAKKKQICWMPRKNPNDILQVINLLKFRNYLSDFELVPIHGKTESECSRILRDSRIFLSSGHPEGCPLPPAEAMACGCITIGYHGMGGAEYFLDSFAFPIAAGDVLAFSKTVERVILNLESDPDHYTNMTRAASAFIRQEYSMEREEHDIVACWTELIQQVKGAPQASTNSALACGAPLNCGNC